MSKDGLYKLKKTELLQIIYEQEKQIKSLEEENNNLVKERDNRIIDLKEAGSIAEASLKINKIFETAQKVADEYIENIKKLNSSKKAIEEKKVETDNAKEKNEEVNNVANDDIKNREENFELITLNTKLICTKKSLIKKIRIFLLIICEKIKVLKLKLAEKKILKNIKKIGKKRKKKIRLDDYNLSLENIKNEVKKQKKKDRKIEFARMSTFYNLIIIAVTIILVTRIFNVIQISGNSMEPSLYSGNFLISTKMFGYKKGDIIAFYYNNSILVKRVIATEGDIVNIDDDGNVYVNSEKIEEDYVEKLSYGNCNITFPYKIQDKQIFVLGDNRENSIDSRNKDIGSISEDKILGKIIMNISQLLFY